MNLERDLPAMIQAAVIWAITEDAELRAKQTGRAFECGYRAGYATGHEVGYGRAHVEMARDWHTAYAAVQAHAKLRTFAELAAARSGKGGDHAC